MPANLNVTVVLLSSAAVFVAYAIRGLTGFGSGLVLTPLLAYLFDVRQVVIFTTILALVAGLYLVILTRQDWDRPALRSVLPASLLFCLLGAALLSLTSPDFLLPLLGVVVIVYALFMLRTPAGAAPIHAAQPRPRRSILFGAASGLLQGLYGTGGPPIVIHFHHTIPTKEAMRGSLLIYFFVLDIARAGAYAALSPGAAGSGLVNPATLIMGLFLLVPAGLGSLCGVRFQSRFSEHTFRRLVAVILLLSGLGLLGRALFQ